MRGVELLNGAAQTWFDWLAAGLLEAAVLLVVVGLVLLATRRRLSAAVAHVLLLVVLVKAVLPFGLPIPRPELSPAELFSGALPDPVIEPASAPTAEKPVAGKSTEPVAVGAVAVVTAPAATSAVASERESPPIVAAGQTRLSWPAWGVLLWLPVMVGMLVQLVLSHWRLRKAVANATPCGDSELIGLAQELATRCGVRREISVVAGSEELSPSVSGWLHPTLIIPRGIEKRLSTEQLRWVLAHELAHVKRGDLQWLLLVRIVQCTTWFNPAVWIAARWAEHYRECACDELALRYVSCSRAECGEAFLALLAGTSARPRLAMQFLTHGRLRKHRLRRLVDGRFIGNTFGRRMSAAFVACVLFLATLSLGEGRAPAKDSGERVARVGGSSTAPMRPRSLEEVKPRIEEIWRQHETKITSARIRARVLHLSKALTSRVQQGHELVMRNREEVNALLDRTDFSRDDCLRKLRDELLVGNLILDQPAFYTVDFTWKQVRERYLYERVNWDNERVVSYDGTAAVEYVPRESQAFIYRYPQFAHGGELDPFVVGLHLRNFGGDSFSSLLRHHEGDRQPTSMKLLPAGRLEVTLPGTPTRSITKELPTTMTWRLSAKEQALEQIDAVNLLQGGYIRELDFREYPGGIVLPRVRISRYFAQLRENATISHITISIVDDAEFNVDIPDSEFRMAVPANTAVWDRRGATKLRAAETATDDVLTLFER